MKNLSPEIELRFIFIENYFTPFSFKALLRLFSMDNPNSVARSNKPKFVQKK